MRKVRRTDYRERLAVDNLMLDATLGAHETSKGYCDESFVSTGV